MHAGPAAVIRRFNADVINGHNLDAVDALVGDDFVDRTPIPGQGPGREGLKQALGGFLGAFADLRLEVLTESADGDQLAQVVRFTGTNDGPFMGMPATGKSISVLGSDFIRVCEGRVVERWGFVDQGAMMLQLGDAPEGPAGS